MKQLIVSCVLLFLIWCNTSPNIPIVSEEQEDSVIDETHSQNSLLPPAKDDSFTEISIPWSHNFQKNNAHPIMWSTLGDFDNDGIQEVFIAWGYKQKDIIIDIKETLPVITPIWWKDKWASYGAYSLDYDLDGDTDIFIARESWLYVYINTDWKFYQEIIWNSFSSNAIPLDIDFWDIDSDGDTDIFISTFIKPSLFTLVTFNDTTHVQSNVLLKNIWDNKYEDVTEEWWLTQKINVFTSSFADIDKDGKIDLVVAPNTWKLQILKNTGEKFESIYTSKNGFWMGLAIVDINNDGLLDVFASNTGNSITERILRWDLRADQSLTTDFAFLVQNIDGSFTNQYNTLYSDWVWFWWWITPLDLHGDGNTEISIAQNNIKWPPHKLSKLPWRTFSYQDGVFQSIEKNLSIENKNYGMATLYGDINGDLMQDIIYINLNESPRVLLQEKDEGERIISLDTKGNPKYLHANIFYTFQDGTIYETQYIPKQWLLSKQSSSITLRHNFIDTFWAKVELHLQNDEKLEIKLENIPKQSIVLK